MSFYYLLSGTAIAAGGKHDYTMVHEDYANGHWSLGHVRWSLLREDGVVPFTVPVIA